MKVHSPGPWWFQQETKIDGEALASPLHTIWTGESWLLARTCYAPASEANARIMAAAPHMLAVLKAARALYRSDRSADDFWCDFDITAVEAAISKAEGG